MLYKKKRLDREEARIRKILYSLTHDLQDWDWNVTYGSIGGKPHQVMIIHGGSFLFHFEVGSFKEKDAEEIFQKIENTKITFGKYITEHHPEFKTQNIPHNNWMKKIANVDRVDQIISGLDYSTQRYEYNNNRVNK